MAWLANRAPNLEVSTRYKSMAISRKQRGQVLRIQLATCVRVAYACILRDGASASCLAKFSKTTSLCAYVFFAEPDQNDMNIAEF